VEKGHGNGTNPTDETNVIRCPRIDCRESCQLPLQILQIQLYYAFVLLGSTRCIRRNIRFRVAGLDEFVVDQVALDLFAAHIREDMPINFHAGRERLPALGLHLPTTPRILNNIRLRIRKMVFDHYGAHTGAPAAICFQLGGNFRRLHSENISQLRKL
jgi:hypothetical protein